MTAPASASSRVAQCKKHRFSGNQEISRCSGTPERGRGVVTLNSAASTLDSAGLVLDSGGKTADWWRHDRIRCP